MRTIAISRLILAAYWIVALALDSPAKPPMRTVALALTAVYAAYALARAVFAWRTPETTRQWQLIRQVADMLMLVVIAAFGGGSAHPFFLGFVFSIVCATLVFEMRGIIATAAAAIVLYIGVTAASDSIDLTPYHFLVRVGFLSAIAALLIQLKLHQQRLRNGYRTLAGWPRGTMLDLSGTIGEILRHAVSLLRVPRVIAVWEDGSAGLLRIAIASESGVSTTEEPIDTFDPVVDRAARLKSFLCTKRLGAPAAQWDPSAEQLRPLEANPIHPGFRERFHVEDVVGSRFTGDSVSGWLFAADREELAEDDVILNDIVAGLVGSRLDHFYVAEAAGDEAVTQERLRIARDLHDRVLQSLTGTALHIQCLPHLIENDPRAALFSIDEIQEALQDDQRMLRSLITKLRSAIIDPEEPRLEPRLAALADRIQREWGLKVSIETTPVIEALTPEIAEEVHSIVREAVTNAAMHSNASRVCVDVMVRNEHVRIVVDDNGHGFRFTGRHTLEELVTAKAGPVTLKERVAAAGGDLTIESSANGARLEIELPMSLEAVLPE